MLRTVNTMSISHPEHLNDDRRTKIPQKENKKCLADEIQQVEMPIPLCWIDG